ncbi:MAG: gliding motility-associated C-terminal domain-containing protein, partial [Bacteroidales bacterium]|nr:gliding motility-associated C-terminal domain-containing protein [Bacteroidales bacterium]
LVVTAPDCDCPTINPPSNPNNPTICFGDVTPALTVDAAVAGYQVNWYDADIGGTPLVTNSTTYTPTETSAGVHTYYAEVEESVSACVSIRIPVTLTIHASPTISGALNMCHGSDNQLTGSGIAHAVTPWTSSNSNATINSNGNISGSTAGSSLITYMDENGCTSSVTVNVIENVLPSFTNLGPYCLNANGGNLSGTSINGITGTWSPASISTNIAGTQTYTFTPTAGQCATTASMDVEIIAIDLSLTTTNPACYGENGSIAFTASGGSGTYSYTVNGSSATSPYSALAGSYTVVVSDGTCSASQNANLIDPELFYVYYTHTNVSCHGGNNGSINIIIDSGESGNETFIWNDGVTSQNRNNLTNGSYAATVTNSHGCSVEMNMLITQPNELIVTGSVIDVTCHNGTNGGLSLITTGGTPDYMYSWSSGQSSSSFSGVSAGSYTVTVTDSKGCTASKLFYLSEPPAIVISAVLTHPRCFGSSDGMIDLTINGGTPGYSYLWNPTGSGSGNQQDLMGASAGNYTVVITDGNSCTVSMSYELVSPQPMVVTSNVTNISCNQANGEISILVNGGTPQYTYQWDAAAMNATTPTISNLTNQDYSVTITDANQCTIEKTIEVGRDIPPTLSLVEQINETCSDSNGQIAVEVTDGKPEYTYSWIGIQGLNSPIVCDICAGNYAVIVTDADGCTDSLMILITNHEEPQVQIVSISPAHCDQADGAARLEVIGGSASYSYDWGTTPARTSIYETHLLGGHYTVTVSDGVCDVAVVVDVPNLPGPTVNASANPSEAYVSRSLIRFNDGSTGATSWNWDFGNGQYSTDRKPSYNYEHAGTYDVILTVIDDYGCTASDSVVVIIHDGLKVWIPNAFTPDGDGLNDLFGPVATGMSLDGYEMVILDRWGKQAFCTTNYHHRWDGTIYGQRVEVNSIYLYKITIKDIFGKKHLYSGRVSVIYGFE